MNDQENVYDEYIGDVEPATLTHVKNMNGAAYQRLKVALDSAPGGFSIQAYFEFGGDGEKHPVRLVRFVLEPKNPEEGKL